MSAVQGEGGQDFDLNLAPIIDCFTVLITYLLVSASFISLTALDVGVAAAGQADPGAAPKTPPYSLMIELAAQQVVTFKLTGGPGNVNLAFPVPATRNGWDIGGLEKEAAKLVKQYPDLKEATMQTDPVIIYRDVVKIVEALKRSLGKVYLAG